MFRNNDPVSSNENERKDEYANIHREHKRSIEGVLTCNRRLTNQRRDICIREKCKYRRTRFRLCSHCLNYSCKNKNLIINDRNPSSSTNYNNKPPTLKNYSSRDYTEKPITLKSYSSKILIGNNWSNPKYTKMSKSPEKVIPQLRPSLTHQLIRKM